MASPVTAKAKVARKKPNATLVTPDRTNVRITRGESCELASCRPTRVIAKTTPTNVSIDEAITPSMVSAVEVRIVLPETPVGRQPDDLGVRDDDGDEDASHDQQQGDEPEPVAHPFGRPHPAVRPAGPGGQRLHLVILNWFATARKADTARWHALFQQMTGHPGRRISGRFGCASIDSGAHVGVGSARWGPTTGQSLVESVAGSAFGLEAHRSPRQPHVPFALRASDL